LSVKMIINCVCVFATALIGGYCYPANAFAFAFAPSQLSAPKVRSSLDARPNHLDDEHKGKCDLSRRNALKSLSLLSISSASAAVMTSRPLSAYATSELFRPNPLTNPILEQVRIWDQDEADNIKYGGELASGSSKATEFDQYVQLLQPILSVENDITTIDQLLQSNNPTTRDNYLDIFQKANQILSKPIFNKVNFKKAFNAFADNIYYSDPDRANLYLGGGAIPKSTQTIAYLLRNDVLTNLEDMNAELQYLLRELEKNKNTAVGGEGGLGLEDLYGFVKGAKQGMIKYLELVPPNELETARSMFKTQ